MGCRRIAVGIVLVLGLLGGCTSSPDTTGPLPDAGELVRASAESLTQLRSVSFTFKVNGSVPGLDVREVSGTATRDGGRYGRAAGEADIQRRLDRAEVEFLLDGERLWLTGLGDQPEQRVEWPVPVGYAPATLLDPERGLRTLLTGATGLETEGSEPLNGVDTFRVAGELPHPVIARLVPGVHTGVDVKFWVSEAPTRHLMRIWVQVPPRQPNEGAVMLELGLTDHNQPPPPTPTE
ncbi:lipoprotein LprG [Amycolatopsis arida]|uniref:Lipoprotein LprG n=1 Tax=Amycolatopsis arida TaxID=587909 RepID=A0A1I6AZF7_9PSEU|nr:LppX_LprAFG lipoprotein [Amycolatopsis arida]TDX92161.1 lipoprotein LprG [Amycolatopsis arida]SFQ74052.1 lipoprotein LprG [Amycolatopsis arida]